jgi:transposase
VYEKAYFSNSEANTIEVSVIPRKGSKPYCSKCGKRCSGYDRLPERRFEFIPFWGFNIFLCYSLRRVDCPECGITAESLPWAQGKHQLTTAYMQYLAHWAKKLSWKEVAVSFKTSWEKVFHSVEYVVNWGLSRRDMNGITAIGVDEIQWQKGHHYLTLVYQINAGCTRLLWIGKERTEATFSSFFDMLGKDAVNKLEFVCSDMWKPYLKVIRSRAGHALHILDRFHIVARMNKALDEIRAQEQRQMKQDGYEPILTKAWGALLSPRRMTSVKSK